MSIEKNPSLIDEKEDHSMFSKDESTSFSGILFRIASVFFFWLSLGALTESKLPPLARIVVLVGIFFLTLFLAGYIARKISDYDKGYLKGPEKKTIATTKYTVYLVAVMVIAWYILYDIGFLKIRQEIVDGGIGDILFWIFIESVCIVAILGVAILLIYAAIYLISKCISFYRAKKEKDVEERVTVNDDYQKADIKVNEWILNKIIAPVIVALILGTVTFIITGDFRTGGAISALSFPIHVLWRR